MKLRGLCLLSLLVLSTAVSMISIDDTEVAGSRNSAPFTHSWPTVYGPPTLNSTVNLSIEGDYPYIDRAMDLPDHLKGNMSSPVIDDNGNIYATMNGYLVCCDSSCSYQWDVEVENGIDITSAPSIGPLGSILVTTSSGFLHSFSSTGSRNWNTSTGLIDDHPIEPVSSGDLIAAPTRGSMGIYDQNGAEVLESDSLDGNIKYPISIDEGPVYYALTDNSVYSLDHQGNINWRRSITGSPRSPVVIDDEHNIYFSNLGSGFTILTSYSPNGTRRWEKIDLDGDMEGAVPVIGSDGNMSYSPMGNTRYLFDKNGNETEIFQNHNDPTLRYLIDRGRELFFFNGFLEQDMVLKDHQLKTFGNGTMMAFFDGRAYFTGKTIFRVSFNDEKLPSYFGGPMDDISIDEDSQYLIMREDLFEIFEGEWNLGIETNVSWLSADIHESNFARLIPDDNVSGSAGVQLILWNSETDLIDEAPDNMVFRTNSFHLEVRSVNDPPMILTQELPLVNIGEPFSIEIQVIDNDSDTGLMTFDTMEPYEDWIYMRKNFLEGVIPYDFNDNLFVEIIAYDTAGDYSIKEFEIEYQITNALPEITTSIIRIDEDEKTNIDIGDEYISEIRVRDNDGTLEHVYEVEPGPMIDIEWNRRTDLDIVPKPDMYGSTWLILTVIDGDLTVSKNITVEIRGMDDPIQDAEIIPLSNISNLTEGDFVHLTVSFDDPEMTENSSYIISWSVGGGRTIQYGWELNTSDLGFGSVDVRALISRNNEEGLRTYAVLELDIQERPGKDEDSDYYPVIDYDRTLAKWMVYHTIILLVLVAVPVVSWISYFPVKRIRDRDQGNVMKTKKGVQP